jgi:hypothetical protein
MVTLGALFGPDRPNGPGLADELLELQLGRRKCSALLSCISAATMMTGIGHWRETRFDRGG